VKLWPRVWCIVFLTHGVYAWPTWIRVSQKVREMSDYSGFLTSIEIGSTCVYFCFIVLWRLSDTSFQYFSVVLYIALHDCCCIFRYKDALKMNCIFDSIRKLTAF